MPKINKKDILKTSLKISKDRGSEDFIERIQNDLENRQSLISLILGALIVVVLGVLIFNFFNRSKGELGTSQTTESGQAQEDVAKDNLPGKYTVKEGDTLFLISQKYYDDGYKYTKLVEENKLSDPNKVEVGQVLEIPKLEENSLAQAGQSPSQTPEATPEASSSEDTSNNATGGAENQTIWGEKITEDSYTVVEGDWLSKIAGRAYGDIYTYDKIAKANNISNPNLIEPGMVIKIPR